MTSPDTIPVSDLLAAADCTAQCLLAREPEGCACRCAGQFHGTLTGSVLEAATPPRRLSAEAKDLKMAYEMTTVVWRMAGDHLNDEERREFEAHMIEVRHVIAWAATRFPGGFEALGWETA